MSCSRLVRIRLLSFVVATSLALSGCVIGRGRCLFLSPLKSQVTGTLHFRDFRAERAIEHVPILSLDQTQYVYAPALSHQCQSAQELQLIPQVDLPEGLGENSHVTARGAVQIGIDEQQRTRFVFEVDSIEKVRAAAK